MVENNNKRVSVVEPWLFFAGVFLVWGFFFVRLWYIKDSIGLAIFSGICVVISQWPFFQPGTTLIFTGTKKYYRYLEQLEKERTTEPGIFTYGIDGFTVNLSNKNFTVLWHDIVAIYGYVVDGTTFWDIVTAGGDIFSLTENTTGWYLFLKTLESHLPDSSKMWDELPDDDGIQVTITCIYEQHNEMLHNYYYGGGKLAYINQDEYSLCESEYYSRVPGM